MSELVKRIRAYSEANGLLTRKLEAIHSLEVLRANNVGRPVEYKLIEPGGRWYAIKAEDLRVACNQAVPGMPDITPKTRVNSGDLEIKVEKAIAPSGGKKAKEQVATVVISGRGFGHGVGMCQYCTRAMSERGDDWQTMVMRFYPGAELVRTYR
jgi:SpoIID/LytB domain protein